MLLKRLNRLIYQTLKRWVDPLIFILLGFNLALQFCYSTLIGETEYMLKADSESILGYTIGLALVAFLYALVATMLGDNDET